jgi:RNA polymerase sigma-70 factor, ECF subfamily
MSYSSRKIENADNLWSLIKLGDEKAFETLFDQIYSGLCIFANRFLHNVPEAEETVHDVFIGLWQNREKMVVTGSIKTYIYHSVYNNALNKLKHFQTLKYQPNKTTDPDLWKKIHNTYAIDDALIQMIESEETEELLQKAIDNLPEKCKEVFLLNRYEGFTYKEVADKLNLSQNTVRVQIFRAVDILRETVNKILS